MYSNRTVEINRLRRLPGFAGFISTLTIGLACTALLLSIVPGGRPSAPLAPQATSLLHTSLDSAAAISAPTSGAGGSTTLAPGDFITASGRLGAQLNASSKRIVFPAASGAVQNVELDRGEIDLWYYPSYAAGDADDATHALVVIGDFYNPPSLVLAESDRLSLTLTEASWSSHVVSAGYHASLWQANTWVHIQASWDTAAGSDSLKLYVNGVRVDAGGAAGGWSLGAESGIGSIFAGVANQAGDFSASGMMDELIIRDEAGAPVTPTQTATQTRTPSTSPTSQAGEATPTTPSTSPTSQAGGATPTTTPSRTSTRAPGCVDRADASATVIPGALPLQPVGAEFSDPRFCSLMRRASNTSDSGGFETQEYSQLQAFSEDNAYLLLDGSEGFLVRRLSDMSRVNGLDSAGWNAPRWYPAQPHTLIYYDDNSDTTLRVQTSNVDNPAAAPVTLFTFPAAYQRIVGSRSFDELSDDGRWMAGMANRSDGSRGIFALNLQTPALGAQLRLPDLYAPNGPCAPDPTWGMVEPDWVGVSPLGNYLVVQWVRDGTTRCSGLETFNIQSGAFVGRAYDSHDHGDLGVDVDGSEFFMTFEESHPDDNNRPGMGFHRLPGPANGFSPPTYLQILEWEVPSHISCRGPRGVCLVTATGNPGSAQLPFENELFLQYTDGRIERLAHHRSSSCGYWVQPRGTISRDGRYVAFASDWGRQLDCGNLGRGDPYIIDRETEPLEPTDPPVLSERTFLPGLLGG